MKRMLQIFLLFISFVSLPTFPQPPATSFISIVAGDLDNPVAGHKMYVVNSNTSRAISVNLDLKTGPNNYSKTYSLEPGARTFVGDEYSTDGRVQYIIAGARYL